MATTGGQMIRGFKKLGLSTDELNKLQENIGQVVQSLSTSQLLNGVLIKDVDLRAATSTQVSHGLGREYIGYIIVKQNANSVIWVANNQLPARFINLNCSADVRASFWVF